MTSQTQKHHPDHSHIPVFLDEVLEVLQPSKGESYIDFTAGYGGHARAVIQKTKAPQEATLVDRDQMALDSLGDLQKQGATLLHQDFATAASELHQAKEQYDMILMDLGVSSPHLDIADRGFSFRLEGPLDMRMDQRQEETAAAMVNTLPEQALASIIREYGEEPKAQRIARAIVNHRPIETTSQLAEIVKKTYRRSGIGYSKSHPATRTFQALRIALNRELEQLQQVLPLLPDLLKDDGRVAIISFHSLEDRLVKRFFQEEQRAGYEARLSLITKKPITGVMNAVHNPRARSAKLRSGVKLKTNNSRKGA